MNEKFAALANRTSLRCYKFHAELKVLIQSIDSLLYCKNDQEFNYGLSSTLSVLDQLLQQFSLEYNDPCYHKDFNAFHEALVAKGRVNSLDHIDELSTRDDEEIRHFITFFPYFRTLLDMHRFQKKAITIPPNEFLSQLTNYRNLLAKHLIDFEVILPLDVLIEAMAIVIHAHRTKNLEERNLFMQFIQSFIMKYNIPNAKCFKGRSTEDYYTAVNWRNISTAIEILTAGNFQDERIESAFIMDLISLHSEIVTLKDCEAGKNADSPLHANLPNIQKIATAHHDKINLEHMKSCIIELLTENPTDSLATRMAVLRIFTIIGECAGNLSQPLLDACPALCQYKSLRKYLIHPELNASVIRLIERLLNDQNSVKLKLILDTELPGFYKALDRLSLGNLSPCNLQMPITTEICNDFCVILKLSENQIRELEMSLPKNDLINTSAERRALDTLLRAHEKIPDFNTLKKQLSKFGFSSNQVKAIRGKLQLKRELRFLKYLILKNRINPAQAVNDLKEILKQKVKDTEPSSIWINHLLDQVNSPSAVLFACELLLNSKAQLTLEEAQTIDAKVPHKTKDISFVKNCLLDLIHQRIPLIPLQDFEQHLVTLELPENCKALWRSAFSRLNNKEKSKTTDHENPEITCRHILSNIDAMMFELNTLDTLRIRQTDLCPSQLLAYEYSLAKFLRHAKYLANNLKLFKDFSDIRSRSIFLKHPIDELQSELQNYLRFRNEVFHLKHLYRHSSFISNPFFRNQRLAGFVEYLTVGTLYPNAILIDGATVTRGPARDISVFQRLQRARDEVVSYDKKLGEAKEKRASNNHDPRFDFAAASAEGLNHSSEICIIEPESNPSEATNLESRK